MKKLSSSNEEIAQVLFEYVYLGRTARRIAKDHGISHQSPMDWLKKSGLLREARGNKVTATQLRHLKAELTERHALLSKLKPLHFGTLAKKYGLTEKSISYHAHEWKLHNPGIRVVLDEKK